MRRHSNKLPKPASKKKDRSDQTNLEGGISVDAEFAPDSGTFIDPPQLKVVCDNMLEVFFSVIDRARQVSMKDRPRPGKFVKILPSIEMIVCLRSKLLLTFRL